MFTIRQNGDAWELVDEAGNVLASEQRYEEALVVLAEQLAGVAELAMDSGGDDGLLPEPWVAPIAFLSEPTGDGRDFSETVWSWRDPSESLLPLMLHTETDMGHFGAQLAGFVTSISYSDGVGTMAGRFYDNEQGRQARDLLLDGRRFGVSVDPGGGTEVEFRCVEQDEDGWCVNEEITFLAYEVIGLTMTPFPGFARAHIVLDTPAESADEAGDESESDEAVAAASVAAEGEHDAGGACCAPCAARAADAAVRRLSPVRASAGTTYPLRPPRSWFDDPQLSRLTPLTVDDETGQVYGHLAPWGQCHTGYQGECVMTPHSQTSYAYFRLGSVRCDNGEDVSTGRLTLGGGHADLSLSFRGAAEHYDNAGAAVADVAAGEDAHGIWIAGALRPGVTPEQVRALRASSLSGDWRPVGSGLELVAALAVNSPGFPIARVASGGKVVALVAAGAGVMARVAADPDDERIARLEAQIAELRALSTADARARLRQLAADRQRDRLRALART